MEITNEGVTYQGEFTPLNEKKWFGTCIGKIHVLDPNNLMESDCSTLKLPAGLHCRGKGISETGTYLWLSHHPTGVFK